MLTFYVLCWSSSYTRAYPFFEFIRFLVDFMVIRPIFLILTSYHLGYSHFQSFSIGAYPLSIEFIISVARSLESSIRPQVIDWFPLFPQLFQAFLVADPVPPPLALFEAFLLFESVQVIPSLQFHLVYDYSLGIQIPHFSLMCSDPLFSIRCLKPLPHIRRSEPPFFSLGIQNHSLKRSKPPSVVQVFVALEQQVFEIEWTWARFDQLNLLNERKLRVVDHIQAYQRKMTCASRNKSSLGY